MRPQTQQTSLFLAIAEQSLAWGRLVVPTMQMSYLHSDGAEYIADFITADEERFACRGGRDTMADRFAMASTT